MNWKEEIKKLLEDKNIKENTVYHTYEYLYNSIPSLMIEFAKSACEEQKKICADYAKTDNVGYGEDLSIVDEKSILNAPTVNFD